MRPADVENFSMLLNSPGALSLYTADCVLPSGLAEKTWVAWSFWTSQYSSSPVSRAVTLPILGTSLTAGWYAHYLPQLEARVVGLFPQWMPKVGIDVHDLCAVTVSRPLRRNSPDVYDVDVSKT